MSEWTLYGHDHSEHRLYLEKRFHPDAVADWRASVRSDGCVDLRRYYNGDNPDDPEAMEDYLHVCDMKEFIDSMLDLVKKSKEHFGEGWE